MNDERRHMSFSSALTFAFIVFPRPPSRRASALNGDGHFGRRARVSMSATLASSVAPLVRAPMRASRIESVPSRDVLTFGRRALVKNFLQELLIYLRGLGHGHRQEQRALKPKRASRSGETRDLFRRVGARVHA